MNPLSEKARDILRQSRRQNPIPVTKLKSRYGNVPEKALAELKSAGCSIINEHGQGYYVEAVK